MNQFKKRNMFSQPICSGLFDFISWNGGSGINWSIAELIKLSTTSEMIGLEIQPSTK